MQEWYAISQTPLTSDTISITTTDTGETWYGVVAFGISGANTASPFDSNSNLPVAQANNPSCPDSVHATRAFRLVIPMISCSR